MDWKEAIETVLKLEEAQITLIAEAFLNDRPVLLRGITRNTAGSPQRFIEVVPIVAPHCKTCQCVRVDAEMPSHPGHPEVKRTKSWHHG
jgi:hypothetical protein